MENSLRRGESNLPSGDFERLQQALGVDVSRLHAEDIAAGLDSVGQRSAALRQPFGAQDSRQWHLWNEYDQPFDQFAGYVHLVVRQMPRCPQE